MTDGFRKDVQGLRAIAVLTILVFHLRESWCPGGFIGVDIFFVISGYLITKLILKDGGEFSFRAFYVRRFFRLFPALLATLALTLVAGWKMLGPADYQALALSAITAAFGVSNFYFNSAVDYFNAASHAHHLLHTWSLGVEEQFYLIWPLVLFMTARWIGRPWIVVAAMGAISFLALQIVQSQHPQPAFYMMPFRIFEFAIGAAVIAIEEDARRLSAPALTAVGFASGVTLAAALFLIDGETAWPGTWSLVVSLATAGLIVAGRGPFWSAVLSQSALVYIGSISYSLYLVHWPIITLYRAYAVADPTTSELLWLGAVALLAGSLLHHVIEQPFRLRSAQSPTVAMGLWRNWSASLRRRAGIVLALSAIMFVGFSAWAVHSGGVPSRLDRGRQQFLDKGLTFAGDICSNRQTRCLIGDREGKSIVYVMGDSHALNLLYGLDQFFRRHRIKGIVFYDNGCLFVTGTRQFIRGAPDKACQKNVADAYAIVAGTTHPIIFAGNYAGYRSNIGDAQATEPKRWTEADYYAWIEERLAGSMRAIHADKRTVILMKQTYSTGIDLAKCLAQPGVVDSTAQGQSKCVPWTLAKAEEAVRGGDRVVESVRGLFPAIVAIDPKLAFCRDGGCTTKVGSDLLFRDTTHLTNAGSAYLIAAIEAELLKGLALK